MAANIRFINPDALTKPPTYTQVVEVTGPGRTVYISGQLATGRDGNLVSGFAWSAHPQFLALFLEVLGTRVLV